MVPCGFRRAHAVRFAPSVKLDIKNERTTWLPTNERLWPAERTALLLLGDAPDADITEVLKFVQDIRLKGPAVQHHILRRPVRANQQ